MEQWLNQWTESTLIVNVATMVGQIVLAILAFLIARSIGKRLIGASFAKMENQKNMSANRVRTLEKLTVNAFSYVLIFVFITIILGIFELDATGLIAGAGIVGLAIGFGAQGLVSDVVTGFFLLLERQIDVEDYVTISGIDGVVEQVGLRNTQLRGFDGTLHFIPNRDISSVSNHSRGNMRALVDIGISYDENIDEATAVLQAACDKIATENEMIIEGPNVIGVQALGSSDIVLRIIAKTENGSQWEVERKLRKELKDVLDANNIEIPYPHQVFIDKKSS